MTHQDASRQRVDPRAGWVLPSRLPKGPNGRALCRYCGTEVPKGRRTFCGQACVDQWSVRTNPTFVREKVLDRDHGICALCGHDAEAAKRELYRKGGALEQLKNSTIGYREYNERLNPLVAATKWEADHIVPVVEGGGSCGLDNYRTLCRPCHVAVTADLRRRLARDRRAAKREALGICLLIPEES